MNWPVGGWQDFCPGRRGRLSEGVVDRNLPGNQKVLSLRVGSATRRGAAKMPDVCSLTRRGALRLTGKEAFAAEYRTSLGRFEGNRGLPAALRAGGHGFALLETAARTLALRLARLAAFGFVLEILIVKKVLLPRGKNEVRSAIYTFEDAILKLRHGLYPRQPEHVVGSVTAEKAPPSG